jgi:hypothetical protein
MADLLVLIAGLFFAMTRLEFVRASGFSERRN